MELWQLKYYIRYRFTTEQKKAMSGKIPMTADLYWGCIGVCNARCDRKRLRWLLDTYPEYMKEFSEDYDRRLEEDPEFRKEQEQEAQRLKNLCLEEFGEDWVKENWRD